MFEISRKNTLDSGEVFTICSYIGGYVGYDYSVSITPFHT
jgi:hypothetical protein